MTSKKALERIMNVLGLSSHSFYEGKTEQGLSVKMEGELEVGSPIYISTEEGLIPAPPGVHKLEDGSEIEVDDDGMVSKIKMGTNIESETEDDMESKDGMDSSDMSKDEFMDIKLKGGGMLTLEGEKPSVGLRVMKKGYDGQLSAITDGLYETTDGQVLSIVGGSIQGVQTVKENEERKTGSEENRKDPLSDIGKSMAVVFQEDGFTIARTSNGTDIESKTFDIGEDISVIKGDGSKEPAPDGEHEVILKDSEGKEVKIRVMVKDGKITERENIEESPSKEDEMSEILSLFKEAMKGLETKIDVINSKQNTLEQKFQKFSKEPAGSRVFTQKTINEESSPTLSKYEAFRKLRENLTQN